MDGPDTDGSKITLNNPAGEPEKPITLRESREKLKRSQAKESSSKPPVSGVGTGSIAAAIGLTLGAGYMAVDTIKEWVKTPFQMAGLSGGVVLAGSVAFNSYKKMEQRREERQKGREAAGIEQDAHKFVAEQELDGKSLAWREGYEARWTLFHRQLAVAIAKKLNSAHNLDPEISNSLRRLYAHQFQQWKKHDPKRAKAFHKKFGKDIVIEDEPLLTIDDGKPESALLIKHLFNRPREDGKPHVGERPWTRREISECRSPLKNIVLNVTKIVGPPAVAIGLVFGANYLPEDMPKEVPFGALPSPTQKSNIPTVKILLGDDGVCEFDRESLTIDDQDIVQFASERPVELEFTEELVILPDRHATFHVDRSKRIRFNFSSNSEASIEKQREISCAVTGGQASPSPLQIFREPLGR